VSAPARKNNLSGKNDKTEKHASGFLGGTSSSLQSLISIRFPHRGPKDEPTTNQVLLEVILFPAASPPAGAGGVRCTPDIPPATPRGLQQKLGASAGRGRAAAADPAGYRRSLVASHWPRRGRGASRRREAGARAAAAEAAGGDLRGERAAQPGSACGERGRAAATRPGRAGGGRVGCAGGGGGGAVRASERCWLGEGRRAGARRAGSRGGRSDSCAGRSAAVVATPAPGLTPPPHVQGPGNSLQLAWRREIGGKKRPSALTQRRQRRRSCCPLWAQRVRPVAPSPRRSSLASSSHRATLERRPEEAKPRARNLALKSSIRSASTSASYTGQGPRRCIPRGFRCAPSHSRAARAATYAHTHTHTHTHTHARPPLPPPPPLRLLLLDLSVCFITPGASPADSAARYLSSARSPLAGRGGSGEGGGVGRGREGERKERGWKLPGAVSLRCCWCCRCLRRRLRLLARPLSASMCRIAGAPRTLLPLLAALLQVRGGPRGSGCGRGGAGGAGSLCSPRRCGAGLRTREGRCRTARPGTAQARGSGRVEGQGGQLIYRASFSGASFRAPSASLGEG
jgi:hypothetical protein